MHRRATEQRDVIAKRGERRRRIRVEPRGVRRLAVAERTSSTPARPSTRNRKSPATGQELHPDVGGRDVVDGRMTGFEDAHCPNRVGDQDSGKLHGHDFVRGFEARRARVVPDGFLVGTGFDAMGHGGMVPQLPRDSCDFASPSAPLRVLCAFARNLSRDGFSQRRKGLAKAQRADERRRAACHNPPRGALQPAVKPPPPQPRSPRARQAAGATPGQRRRHRRRSRRKKRHVVRIRRDRGFLHR